MERYVLIAVLAYLLGNVQCAILLSKFKYHDDIRNHGSGNAGSTNMLRVFGLKPGLITFAGDFIKGVLAVVMGRLIAGETGAYVASLFVVLGHDFPVFMHFKGGKGVASTFGIAWMLNPLYAAVVTAYAAIMLYLTRTVAIVSLTGVIVYLILALLFQLHNTPFVVLVAILLVLVTVRHTENIKRIFTGKENKLFEKKGKKDSENACDQAK